jgi:hypothetical protein
MSRWIYAIRGFKGNRLLLETTHATEASKAIEIAAWRIRMARGEASHVEVTALTSPYGTETIYPTAETCP